MEVEEKWLRHHYGDTMEPRVALIVYVCGMISRGLITLLKKYMFEVIVIINNDSIKKLWRYDQYIFFWFSTGAEVSFVA